MVGALQRHHACRREKLESASIKLPGTADARQIWDAAGKAGAVIRHLFIRIPHKARKTGAHLAAGTEWKLRGATPVGPSLF
ncbi:hypothetical protein HUK65_13540 [Rhodobacteraceae bacterium 2376]|uniref:Uncharacterized protein n=1 Tax=Rhabdonatronobacter sediminivivens TaxID=2743469 RepID=A0A7Z0I158_9RHOB|nr:hypothetical protein [Rhabdonatronobacter sediminivivens]NYS26013.1 hypothetical protein [Rhabdonatronobacter sediminivivens]